MNNDNNKIKKKLNINKYFVNCLAFLRFFTERKIIFKQDEKEGSENREKLKWRNWNCKKGKYESGSKEEGNYILGKFVIVYFYDWNQSKTLFYDANWIH